MDFSLPNSCGSALNRASFPMLPLDYETIPTSVGIKLKSSLEAELYAFSV